MIELIPADDIDEGTSQGVECHNKYLFAIFYKWQILFAFPILATRMGLLVKFVKLETAIVELLHVLGFATLENVVLF